VSTPTRPRRARARKGKAALPPRFVVVTGLSGAGKSHALRALEDLGYFCVDNLPVALIPAFADLVVGRRREIQRAAVVVDVREGHELARFPAVYRRLATHYGPRIKLVFLEATDAAILRRFSETRRPHPLGLVQPVADGITHERRLLQPLRQLAAQVVDTSRLTVHDLRRVIIRAVADARRATPLLVNFTSFGFRRGTPPEADLVFDVRFLPNPHFVTALRPWSGKNARVSRYVLRSRAASRFLALTTKLLRFLIPQYISEGKTYLTIGVGCTGGRHRSVAIGEALGRRLRGMPGIEVQVRHRDVTET
jgi:RNase adapter protein RapZ